jgi:hypothetical protein
MVLHNIKGMEHAGTLKRSASTVSAKFIADRFIYLLFTKTLFKPGIDY